MAIGTARHQHATATCIYGYQKQSTPIEDVIFVNCCLGSKCECPIAMLLALPLSDPQTQVERRMNVVFQEHANNDKLKL